MAEKRRVTSVYGSECYEQNIAWPDSTRFHAPLACLEKVKPSTYSDRCYVVSSCLTGSHV